ncbi:DeoR family transcriptional regulator [Scopulibacillus darangshiensis]|uniref:DeoR family transcriptional regulator n=1 Tax=Scopulibacillus darangshiensis TaxID=442528 RepID=A0A4R2NPS4_9BACL|nr:DeoR/GlpR family DNA-binding transcription regulator [Scopulibacillus darangshiensis]TCP23780.1 DeoR family transcriptional regulator [Scopulibacillus darangshiensis]
MFVEERRQKILEYLTQKGRLQTKQLVSMLDVSIDTIRRDLLDMEARKLLKRTHGGAISMKNGDMLQDPSSLIYQEGSPEQKAVAKEAVAYIRRGDTIFIGTSFLHHVMLNYIPRSEPFTVVTNGLKIADVLKDYEHIDTYLIGGKIKPSGSIVDAFAIEFLKGLKIDLCYLAGEGLTPSRGLSTTASEDAVLLRTAAEVSGQIICMATHERLGNEAFARVLSLDHIDTVITDWEAPKDELQRIFEQGAEVIVVGDEK